MYNTTIKRTEQPNRIAKSGSQVGQDAPQWTEIPLSAKPAGAVPEFTEEVRNMKYNLSRIMVRAWKNYRKDGKITFGEALHRSWLSAKAESINEQRVEAAKEAAGVTEEVNTWSAWKQMGYEVIYGSKALFQTVLIWGSRGDNATYTASFFSRSQVQEIATA